MMWLFLGLWILTTALLIGSLMQTTEVQKMEKSRSHAFCVATIFSVIGDAAAARTLRDAAARFESIEEIPNLTRIRREQYKPDGPSVPALWLRAEADRLDPQKQGVSA